ncbi:hypothetical protein BGZ92_007707 [Podila epicladia]|nr:hypothetical protein BGZ92_007707 [Podila epicladia]
MSMVVDRVTPSCLGETDVDKDPILVPSCGHALTMTALDDMMEMGSYYEQRIDSETGATIYIAKRPLPGNDVKQVPCLSCQQPIVSLLRYGRRIKNAQLSLSLKEHLFRQEKALTVAKDLLDDARMDIEDERDTFRSEISSTPIYFKFAPPNPASRRLGKYAREVDAFPITDFFTIAETYSIPPEHRDAWVHHMKPVVAAIKELNNVNKMAAKSPTSEIFEAAFSHLCQVKVEEEAWPALGTTCRSSTGVATDAVVLDGTSTSTIRERIIECGLPADGHAGSSYIASLVEKTNALLLVLSEASAAMESVGTLTGWYWFVEDIRNCCLVYTDLAMEAATNGHYYHRVAYLRVVLLELLCDQVRWLGLRPLPDDQAARETRFKHVRRLLELFMEEMEELEEGCPLGVAEGCLARSEVIEEKMVAAVRMAQGPEIVASGNGAQTAIPAANMARLSGIRAVLSVESKLEEGIFWMFN